MVKSSEVEAATKEILEVHSIPAEVSKDLTAVFQAAAAKRKASMPKLAPKPQRRIQDEKANES